MSQIRCWALGISKARYDDSPPESRHLAVAHLPLLLISMGVAAVAMGFFVYVSLPADLPASLQGWVSAGIGFVWALIVGMIDRVLILVGASLGGRGSHMKLLLIAVRLGVAALVSNLLAEQLVLAYYAAPIKEAAQKIANEERIRQREQLDGLHGIAGHESAVNTLLEQDRTLDERRRTLPPDVQTALAKVAPCDRQAQRIADRLNGLPAQRSDLRSALQRDLQAQRRTCTGLRTAAESLRNRHFDDVRKAMAENSAALVRARTSLDQAQTDRDAEIARQALQTAAWSLDSSSRDIAFARAKADHPDIAKGALGLWSLLFLLEIFPLFIKTIIMNDPIARGTQRILAEATATEQAQLRWIAEMDVAHRKAWQRSNVRAAAVAAEAHHAQALTPVLAYESFLQGQADVEQRLRRLTKDNPRLHAQSLTGFATALRRSFEQLNGQPAPRAAAE